MSSKDIQIIELDNEDIEVQIDSCSITWSELLGNPANNSALISLLTTLLEEKIDKKVAPLTPSTRTKITYDENGLVTAGSNLSIEDLPTLHLEDISDVTATVDEVNKLHGLQATKNELDILHGATLTTSELNTLSGLQASTVELNKLKGLLITCAQLNMLQGIRSNIQEQLDNKMDNVEYLIERQENKTEDFTSESDITYPNSKALTEALKTKQDVLSSEQLDKLNNAVKQSELTGLLNNKIDKNNPITAGTATKVNYDTNGLITGQGSLTESDIPSLHLLKISDVTATATEVNKLSGLTVGAEQINQLDGATSNVQNQINNITNKLPDEVSITNKLADKDFVRNWVNEHAGFFLTKDTSNSCFESMAELNNTQTFYHNGEVKVPTENDYVIVKKDETKDNIVSMYGWVRDGIIYYQGHWQFMYRVSNSWTVESYNKDEVDSKINEVRNEVDEVDAKIDKGHVVVSSDTEGHVVLNLSFTD